MGHPFLPASWLRVGVAVPKDFRFSEHTGPFPSGRSRHLLSSRIRRWPSYSAAFMVAQHNRLASLTRRFFARYGFELKSALPVSKSTGHETRSWTTSHFPFIFL